MKKSVLTVVVNIITSIGLGVGLLACNGAGYDNTNGSAQNSNPSSTTAEATNSKAAPGTEYAYIADVKNYKVRMNKVESDGKLVELATAAIGEGTAAYVTISPNQRFAYIPSSYSSTIKVFSINQSTGILTLVQDAPLPTLGSQRLVFTPDNKYAYAGSTDNYIHEFSVDPKTGYLSYMTKVKANAPDYMHGLKTAIDNNGKYLYAAPVVTFNPSNLIQLFKINPNTGQLSAGDFYPVENAFGATSMNVSSDNILYATFILGDGLTGNNVYSYKIDPDSGGLATISAIVGGENPYYLLSTYASRFVYYASTIYPNSIYQYAVADDGSLNPLSPATIPLSTNAFSTMSLNTANNKLYTFDYNGFYYIYDINASGQLTQAPGPIVINNNNAKPTDIAFVRKLIKPVMLEPAIGSRNNVAESTNILIELPANVDPASINTDTVQITQTTKPTSVTKGSHSQYIPGLTEAVAFGIAYTVLSNGYLMLTLDPTNNLHEDALVKIGIHGAKYYDGVPLKSSVFSFNTRDEQVFLVQPIDTANAPENTLIRVGFALPIKKSTVNDSNFYITLNGDDEHIQGSSGWNGNVLEFQANENYFTGTNYQIHIGSGIQAKNGAQIQIATLPFKTSNEPNPDLLIYEAMGEVKPNGGYYGYTGQMQGLEGADRRCNNDGQKPNNCHGSCYFKAMVSTLPHVDPNNREALGRYICRRLTLATGEVVVRCGVGYNHDWVLAPNQRYINYNGQEVGTTNQNQLLPNPLLNAIDPVGALNGQFSLPARTALDPEWVTMPSQCYYLTSGSADLLTSYGTPTSVFTPDVIASAQTNCVVPQGLICVEQLAGIQ